MFSPRKVLLIFRAEVGQESFFPKMTSCGVKICMTEIHHNNRRRCKYIYMRERDTQGSAPGNLIEEKDEDRYEEDSGETVGPKELLVLGPEMLEEIGGAYTCL
jgi:hypothetical protein